MHVLEGCLPALMIRCADGSVAKMSESSLKTMCTGLLFALALALTGNGGVHGLPTRAVNGSNDTANSTPSPDREIRLNSAEETNQNVSGVTGRSRRGIFFNGQFALWSGKGDVPEQLSRFATRVGRTRGWSGLSRLHSLRHGKRKCRRRRTLDGPEGCVSSSDRPVVPDSGLRQKPKTCHVSALKLLEDPSRDTFKPDNTKLVWEIFPRKDNLLHQALLLKMFKDRFKTGNTTMWVELTVRKTNSTKSVSTTFSWKSPLTERDSTTSSKRSFLAERAVKLQALVVPERLTSANFFMLNPLPKVRSNYKRFRGGEDPKSVQVECQLAFYLQRETTLGKDYPERICVWNNLYRDEFYQPAEGVIPKSLLSSWLPYW